MSKETKLPNEADILTLNEQLTSQLSAKSAEATNLSGQLQLLTTTKADLEKQLAEARQQAADLQKENAGLAKERDELKAAKAALEKESKDFNARLAAELSKYGIRKEALAHKPEADRKLTLTEQCQAAKGAK